MVLTQMYPVMGSKHCNNSCLAVSAEFELSFEQSLSSIQFHLPPDNNHLCKQHLGVGVVAAHRVWFGGSNYTFAR